MPSMVQQDRCKSMCLTSSQGMCCCWSMDRTCYHGYQVTFRGGRAFSHLLLSRIRSLLYIICENICYVSSQSDSNEGLMLSKLWLFKTKEVRNLWKGLEKVMNGEQRWTGFNSCSSLPFGLFPYIFLTSVFQKMLWGKHYCPHFITIRSQITSS